MSATLGVAAFGLGRVLADRIACIVGKILQLGTLIILLSFTALPCATGEILIGKPWQETRGIAKLLCLVLGLMVLPVCTVFAIVMGGVAIARLLGVM
jgi:hypothetical protein